MHDWLLNDGVYKISITNEGCASQIIYYKKILYVIKNKCFSFIHVTDTIPKKYMIKS